MTVEQVRMEREMREKRAKARAEKLPPGDYYAAGCFVVDHASRREVVQCESHWDACLVIISTPAPEA